MHSQAQRCLRLYAVLFSIMGLLSLRNVVYLVRTFMARHVRVGYLLGFWSAKT
jgi:hypothetical protein